MKKEFKNLSIRARIAYAIMCFEEYVLVKYPTINFSKVGVWMWAIVSTTEPNVDELAYKYLNIVPECLYEFDSFEKGYFEDFSKEEYDTFVEIIPKDDEILNYLMNEICEIVMIHMYTTFSSTDNESIVELKNITNKLVEVKIPLPDISLLAKYNPDLCDGWGCEISHKGLFKILI